MLFSTKRTFRKCDGGIRKHLYVSVSLDEAVVIRDLISKTFRYAVNLCAIRFGAPRTFTEEEFRSYH